MGRALVLTPELRVRLKRPLGELLKGEPDEVFAVLSERLRGRLVITVGDVVTSNALKHGLRPWAAIVDGKAMRRPVAEELPLASWSKRLRVMNPPSTISEDAWSAVGMAVREGDTLVLVEGEEDLLALVAILCAPEGAVVLYGQPGEGVVLVEVNAAAKALCRELITSMRPVG
mgnify:CR=1 FL=1